MSLDKRKPLQSLPRRGLNSHALELIGSSVGVVFLNETRLLFCAVLVLCQEAELTCFITVDDGSKQAAQVTILLNLNRKIASSLDGVVVLGGVTA